MSNAKIRATILDIDGKIRYEIMRKAISRYNLAMTEGFYLEATTLMESLITDRLESRLGELSNKRVQFDTIRNLTKKLNKYENDEILMNFMNNEINKWCSARNQTIHQAVKIELGVDKNWESFLGISKKAA